MLNSDLILTDISDHLPTFAVLDFPIFKSLSLLLPIQSLLRRQIKTSNIANLKHNLLNTDWTFIKNDSNVNENYDKVISLYKSNHNLCCPLVHANKPKRSNTPWMTPALICSSKHKNKLYFEFLKGKVSADTYKTYRNKFNGILKARKTQYFNNIIDKHRKNAKAMWNMLNNYLGRSKPASHPISQI